MRLAYAPGLPLVTITSTYVGHGRLLMPGDSVPTDLAEHHTLALFRQGRISMRDDPWSAMMLARHGIKLVAPVPTMTAPAVVDEHTEVDG